MAAWVAAFWIVGPVNAQTLGDYRTHQTGNWSDVASWERFNGATWITPAPAAPTLSDGVISILGGHTVSIDSNLSADQIVIDSNGTVTVRPTITLTVADGADSVDMVVNGTLNQFGTVSAAGRISIENGGFFIYSVPAGADIAMPPYVWRTGSTCRIDSTTGTTPTNLRNQTLCNLVRNGTNSGANGGPNFNDGPEIYGDVTLLSSKG